MQGFKTVRDANGAVWFHTKEEAGAERVRALLDARWPGGRTIREDVDHVGRGTGEFSVKVAA